LWGSQSWLQPPFQAVNRLKAGRAHNWRDLLAENSVSLIFPLLTIRKRGQIDLCKFPENSLSGTTFSSKMPL